jgi:hypothetical protein
MKFRVYRHFAAGIEGKDVFTIEAESKEAAKRIVIEDEELEPDEHIIDCEFNNEYLAFEAEEIVEDAS